MLLFVFGFPWFGRDVLLCFGLRDFVRGLSLGAALMWCSHSWFFLRALDVKVVESLKFSESREQVASYISQWNKTGSLSHRWHCLCVIASWSPDDWVFHRCNTSS